MKEASAGPCEAASVIEDESCGVFEQSRSCNRSGLGIHGTIRLGSPWTWPVFDRPRAREMMPAPRGSITESLRRSFPRARSSVLGRPRPGRSVCPNGIWSFGRSRSHPPARCRCVRRRLGQLRIESVVQRSAPFAVEIRTGARVDCRVASPGLAGQCVCAVVAAGAVGERCRGRARAARLGRLDVR